jgi:hypothetical protein
MGFDSFAQYSIKDKLSGRESPFHEAENEGKEICASSSRHQRRRLPERGTRVEGLLVAAKTGFEMRSGTCALPLRQEAGISLASSAFTTLPVGVTGNSGINRI